MGLDSSDRMKRFRPSATFDSEWIFRGRRFAPVARSGMSGGSGQRLFALATGLRHGRLFRATPFGTGPSPIGVSMGDPNGDGN